jgi:hypothetical protein
MLTRNSGVINGAKTAALRSNIYLEAFSLFMGGKVPHLICPGLALAKSTPYSLLSSQPLRLARSACNCLNAGPSLSSK